MKVSVLKFNPLKSIRAKFVKPLQKHNELYLCKPHNIYDRFQYSKLFFNGCDNYQGQKAKASNKILAFLVSLLVKSKHLNLVKNSDDKIVGGYASNMITDNTLYIASMVLNKNYNSMLGKEKYGALKLIYKSIATQFHENPNIKDISIIVDKRSDKLLKMYKKLGFKSCDIVYSESIFPQKNMFYYRMRINKEDFLNNQKKYNILWYDKTSR